MRCQENSECKFNWSILMAELCVFVAWSVCLMDPYTTRQELSATSQWSRSLHLLNITRKLLKRRSLTKSFTVGYKVPPSSSATCQGLRHGVYRCPAYHSAHSTSTAQLNSWLLWFSSCHKYISSHVTCCCEPSVWRVCTVHHRTIRSFDDSAIPIFEDFTIRIFDQYIYHIYHLWGIQRNCII